MSSISLIYSNRKVCARYDGQNRRFRLFAVVDLTMCKVQSIKGKRKVEKVQNFEINLYMVKLLVNFKITH